MVISSRFAPVLRNRILNFPWFEEPGTVQPCTQLWSELRSAPNKRELLGKFSLPTASVLLLCVGDGEEGGKSVQAAAQTLA